MLTQYPVDESQERHTRMQSISVQIDGNHDSKALSDCKVSQIVGCRNCANLIDKILREIR